VNNAMTTDRLEAFSDGVFAIIITILVLNLKVPHGTTVSSLRPVVAPFLNYTLSFAFIGIYWLNHHHLLRLTRGVSGGVLLANLLLLFCISLLPFTTGWMGNSHFATVPVVAYGVVLLACAISYFALEMTILSREGPDSVLSRALGRETKGRVSVVIYVAAVAVAFVNRWVAVALYVLVALMWLVPDRRIERAVPGPAGAED
jgi:uncharacterized membrane protein